MLISARIQLGREVVPSQFSLLVSGSRIQNISALPPSTSTLPPTNTQANGKQTKNLQD
jgi:hypothetical protein